MKHSWVYRNLLSDSCWKFAIMVEYTQTEKKRVIPDAHWVSKQILYKRWRQSWQYSQLFSEHYSKNKSTCEIAEPLEELNISKRFMPFSAHHQNAVERLVR